MASEKPLENQIDLEIYTKHPFFKIKYLLIFPFFFTIGFLANYPILEQLDNLLKKSLAIAAPCGIKYDSLDYGIFPPKLQVKHPVVSAECLSGASDLVLTDLNIIFGLPSFTPLGLNFLLETSLHRVPISIHYIMGLSEHIFKIDSLKIKGETVHRIIGEEYYKGDFELTTLINFTPPKTLLMKSLIKSKDFELKSFNWKDIEIPSMVINNFVLKFELNEKHVLHINDLILGDIGSPIALNFKGKAFLDLNNLSNTGLDLNGEFKLSDQLIKSFSILSLFLEQLEVKDGYYLANITGSLAAPIFK